MSNVVNVPVPAILHLAQSQFADFLQLEVPPTKRENKGLERLFGTVFPLRDFSETNTIEVVNYTVSPPTQSPALCRSRSESYQGSVRGTFRFIATKQGDQGTEITHIFEQEVPLFALPWLSPEQTFIINGQDRVLTLGLAKRSGVLFTNENKNGKVTHIARLFHHRGVDYEFRLNNNLLYVSINRRRKLPVTTLLNALGMNTSDILRSFFTVQTINVTNSKQSPSPVFRLQYDRNALLGQRAPVDIVNTTGSVVVARNHKFLKRTLNLLESQNIKDFPVPFDFVVGLCAADDIFEPKYGEVLVCAGEYITPEHLHRITKANLSSFPVIMPSHNDHKNAIISTLQAFPVGETKAAKLSVLQKVLWYDISQDHVEYIFNQRLLTDVYNDLSYQGDISLSERLYGGRSVRPLSNVITKQDILLTIEQLVTKTPCDPPNHLAHAQVHTLADQLFDALYIGFERVERQLKEILSLVPEPNLEFLTNYLPRSFRAATSALLDFFSKSPHSQRALRNNPLATLATTTTLLAKDQLNPSATRNTFSVSDTHPSHAGRICPVEVPTLHHRYIQDFTAATLAWGADVQRDKTIARTCVSSNNNTETTRSLTYRDEDEQIIAPDEQGNDLTFGRDSTVYSRLGVTATLVPFVQHNAIETTQQAIADMQSAIPLQRSDTPLVLTGTEQPIAQASGLCVYATTDNQDASTLREHVFQPTSSTCTLHQRLTDNNGESVRAGDLLVEPTSCRDGHLALGQNLFTAVMHWHGFNDQNSIVVSERVVEQELFTSIHVRSWVFPVKIKPGQDRFNRMVYTNDVLEEDRLNHHGLIRTGVTVGNGNVLQGILSDITDVISNDEGTPFWTTTTIDNSIRAPLNCRGVVTSAQLLNTKKTTRTGRNNNVQLLVMQTAEKKQLEPGTLLATRHGLRAAVSRIVPQHDMPFLPNGLPVDVVINPSNVFERQQLGLLLELWTGLNQLRTHRALTADRLHTFLASVPRVTVPPFTSATELALRTQEQNLNVQYLDTAPFFCGQTDLIDGISGEFFEQPITVGPLYFFKVPPTVDEVCVARSRGERDPKSQQPAGTRHCPEGQWFDEDEVWALIANGCAFTLSETLTVRSDAVEAANIVDQRILRTSNAGHWLWSLPEKCKILLRDLQTFGFEFTISGIET